MTKGVTSRWLVRLGLLALALTVLVAVAVWLFLRGSLARLDGDVSVDGLGAKVTVTRDDHGVPTISGDSRNDVAYATGYVHAQDRFFQMDLLRRVAAGELAGLIGEAALPVDEGNRFHRMRARAEVALAALTPEQRAMLDRYVAGVNDGLAALSSRPFEYGLLQQQPRAWVPADTLLVVWAMYFDLQDNLESRELARGWLRDHSTPEQLAVLMPELTANDAPMDVAKAEPVLAPLPEKAPDWFGQPGEDKRASIAFRSSVGSNNWAIAGSRTAHGGAIVADDMHLGIRLPHIWYRAVLNVPDSKGGKRRVVGVTLPGAPLVVVGSNGAVAWGFTNSYGDYLDLLELGRDPQNPQRFKIGESWETATEHVEQLEVKGKPAVAFKVIETSLGPVRMVGDKAYAVRWVAHDKGAVNFNLGNLEQVNTLAEAQAVANRAGVPAQNMVAGDAAGNIGWTIAGPLPGRAASSAQTFPYPASADAAWTSLRAPDDYPRVINPDAGQLWTANSRQLGGADYAKLGDGGADLGARASQIRDGLTALGKTDEQGVFGVGLDDRALFIGLWRDRALAALTDSAVAAMPQRAEFRRLLKESWTGHASVDSVGYTLARAWMYALYAELFGRANADMAKLNKDSDFDRANPRWPAVVARLLDERPAGWLPAGKDWRSVELAAVDRAIREVTKDGTPLAQATWGKRNTAMIAHPFTRFLPALKPWLSAPADMMPGDENMPRVAGPAFGQSQRLSVSPGREEQGLFNMPGGQSGHPLSPYFLTGHAEWVQGKAQHLLPGEAVHTLSFVPK
ncbi:penicillin acylase family protein [Chitinimonas sp. BJYL2]|uniref:penicillin acylase family protein n=1 Tax=Chitinimonas sp. BJYL2 TaxID=2976696 RepID=UPI0022B4D763|nr:penicillin acylase family protein [Chitinimonas sp. BJYL2]